MQDHKAILDGDTGPSAGNMQRRLLPSGKDHPQILVLGFSPGECRTIKPYLMETLAPTQETCKGESSPAASITPNVSYGVFGCACRTAKPYLMETLAPTQETCKGESSPAASITPNVSSGLFRCPCRTAKPYLMETLAPTQETCKGEILPSGIDHPKCQFWGF